MRKLFHQEQMRVKKKLYYILLIPTIVISCTVSTGLFSLIATNDSCGNIADTAVKAVLAILSVTGSVLGGISTGVDFNGKSQSHKDATDSYDSLIHIIDTIVKLPDHLRGNVQSTIQSIRQLYDRCIEAAPSLPSTYDEKLIPKPSIIHIPPCDLESNVILTPPKYHAIDIDHTKPVTVEGIRRSSLHAINFELDRLRALTDTS
jgi:hypothetical protein